MKPSAHGIAASMVACALLALLPACGMTRPGYEPAPHYVTVIEADGTSYSMRAEDAGVGGIERVALSEFALVLILAGSAAMVLVLLVGFGIYSIFRAMYEDGKERDKRHHDPYRN